MTPVPTRCASTEPWLITPADETAAAALAADAGLSPVVARILHSRGITTPHAVREFLLPDLDRSWNDPETLPGMGPCADAVAAAVRQGRRIVVFGDFDVDGLTAAAIAARGLAAMGADVTPFVPHRFREGYGLTPASVERVLALAPELVITVDCGISSAVEVEMLTSGGAQVVVTDHHEPADLVPEGVPVCDPKLGSEGFRELAGAGVALKLVAAVGGRLGCPDVWRTLTDLAALGTVADVVPLLDENRAIVSAGLALASRDTRPCLRALCEVASVDCTDLGADRVSYALAPRLNAAGRVSDPAEALNLLMTDDPERATEIAHDLERYNRIRQSAEAELLEAALVQAKERWQEGARLLLLEGEGWHEGVRGIVATRLAARYGVPVMVFSVEGGEARGSGRSIGTVDLHRALASASRMLMRFGGHAAAVGATLPAERLGDLAAAMSDALAVETAEAYRTTETVDAEIALAEATRELAADISALAPFGEGNRQPLLGCRGVFLNGRKRVGEGADHLKFEAFDGVTSIPAIAFRCRDVERLAGHDGPTDIAFCLETDRWRGRERVQLVARVLVARDPAPGADALVDELFADADRVLARGAYEHVEEAESFHTKLAGVTFEGRQEVVARLETGALLRVQRQPDNEHDPNAIALYDPVGDQVGFFNRGLAAALAPVIDRGASFRVTVSEVTGTEKESRGVNVLVERADLEAEAGADKEARLERRADLSALPPESLEPVLVRALIGDRGLHDAQRVSLTHLAAGESCLTVMATGRGKSLIFHLHAARIALTRGDASVFVYPLRALVADQSFHLDESFGGLGLRAMVLTGETAAGRRDEVFEELAAGSCDVVMTTPEFLERHVSRFAASGRVRFLVVDEAHHVGLARSGRRPAYARLGPVLEALGEPTVCALTATAGEEMAAAIRSTLRIEHVVTDPTTRTNLRVDDQRGTADKVGPISSLAAHGGKTIVYVNSREQSVRIAQRLRDLTPALLHRVAFYNGGLSRSARHAVETAFR
jgi:single-stranded-DNA-specific exonuclease